MNKRLSIALLLCLSAAPLVACDKAPATPTAQTAKTPAAESKDPVDPDTPNIAKDSLEMKLSEEDTRALAQVLSGYLDIQEALANSKYPEAMAAAKKLKLDIDRVILTKRASSKWKKMSGAFAKHTHALTETPDLKSARVAFVTLTSDIQAFLEMFGNVTDQPVRQAFCPMAFDNKGGAWFQRSKEVDNVYYGDEMRQCGEIQKTINPTEKLM